MIRAQGLYAWIYRSIEWYVTDPNAPHAARESGTVQFPPTVVPSYDGLLDRAVKIVGVSDDYDRVARCEAALHEQFGRHVSASRSQPYYVDVTSPAATKGVVVERLSHPVPDPAGADRHARRRGERRADVRAERAG